MDGDYLSLREGMGRPFNDANPVIKSNGPRRYILFTLQQCHLLYIWIELLDCQPSVLQDRLYAQSCNYCHYCDQLLVGVKC